MHDIFTIYKYESTIKYLKDRLFLKQYGCVKYIYVKCKRYLYILINTTSTWNKKNNYI